MNLPRRDFQRLVAGVAALPALSRVAGVVLSPGFIADETRNRGKAVKFAGIKAD